MATPLVPLRRENFLKNIGIALLVLLTIVSLIGIYGRPLERIEDVSLTKIVEEIQQGKVESISVEQELGKQLHKAAAQH